MDKKTRTKPVPGRAAPAPGEKLRALAETLLLHKLEQEEASAAELLKILQLYKPPAPEALPLQTMVLSLGEDGGEG